MLFTNNKLLQSYFFFIFFQLIANCLAVHFASKVKWECSDTAIDVHIHTTKPFYGLIQSRNAQKSTDCSIQGYGSYIIKFRIELSQLTDATDENNFNWQKCGLQMEMFTSTLWIEFEIHEHPTLILHQDRLVNVSCPRWAQKINNEEEELTSYKLAFRAVNATTRNDEFPLNYLNFGQSYELLLLGDADADSEQKVRVESCTATSVDRSFIVELIGSDSCSRHPNLMSEFQSLIDFPSSALTTSSIKPDTSRVTLAASRIPSMFRFNSESPKDALVRFECNVQPCGKEEQAPCQPQPDCESKRDFARQGPGNEEIPEAELAMVTHLLSASDDFSQGDENLELTTNDTNGNGNNGIDMTSSAVVGETTTMSNSSGTHKTSRSPVINGGIGLGHKGWHRVRTMVHVLDDAANHVREKTREDEFRNIARAENQEFAQTTTTEETTELVTTREMATVGTTNAIKNSSSLNISEKEVDLRFRQLLHPTTTTASNTIGPSSFSLGSLLYASSTTNNNNSSCITPQQLLNLYHLGIGLCVLFLFGCFCNLLMCCFTRRAGKSFKSHSSPSMRSKRGRNHHQILIPSSAPTSHSTLTSSLYGPGNVMVNNCEAPKISTNAQQLQQKVGQKEKSAAADAEGFWISDNGRENTIGNGVENESGNFGPMLSSIYGALPVQPPPNSNRRSSVHSYASVKAPHSTILRGNPASQQHHLLSSNTRMPPNHVQQQQQQIELAQHGNSLSPSHSPSTTTSSGGGSTAQQMSRTFHPEQPQFEQEKQQVLTDSLASSSVRSSTLGTPSLSETDPMGLSTPRPSDAMQDDANSSSTFGRPQHQPSPITAFLPTGTQQQIINEPRNESFSIF